jgi:hypothetical protein
LEELALPSVGALFKKWGVVHQPPSPQEAQALVTRKAQKKKKFKTIKKKKKKPPHLPVEAAARGQGATAAGHGRQVAG